MGRPRIHPRKLYRAIESGVYIDQETGDELTYVNRKTILPDKDLVLDQGISMSRQEKMAKKLVNFGVFEPLEDDGMIERVSEAPPQIQK